MSEGLTPYTLVILRLVVQPKFQEHQFYSRTKQVLAEEVVKFLMREMEVAIGT